MREIKKIIIHCSDSTFGNAEEINRWHKQRGWDEIGYNYVILNGCVDKVKYIKDNDGKIEDGRNLEKIPAHCKGENEDSIGICLVGKYHFTPKQIMVSLPFLLGQLMDNYGLTKDDIYGHYNFSSKTCPNFDVNIVKAVL